MMITWGGGERELDGKQGILLILGSVFRVWNALNCSRRTEEPAVELRELVALRSWSIQAVAHRARKRDKQYSTGAVAQARAARARTVLLGDEVNPGGSERTQRAGVYTDGSRNVGGGRASMAHIEGGVIEPEKARSRQEARKKSGGDTGIEMRLEEAPDRCQRSLEAKLQSIRQPPTGFMQKLLPGGICLAKAGNQQSPRSEGEQVEGGGSDGDGVNLTCVNKSTHLVERPRAINSGGQAGQRWARKSSQRSGRAKSRGPVIYQIPVYAWLEWLWWHHEHAG
ncbi:hypothetical protein K438DRAFT_1785537 [Mycena galopus ATCC 62051]|nr:hypothetical protein K438DRAFT_1785537 [Mycena galopus ATCC 62051]